MPGEARVCPACGFGRDDPTVPGQGTETSRQTRVAEPQPAPPGQRFVPGSLVEKRYRILGLLGKGGMGEVYRADDLKLGHAVALKFLPEALRRDAGALERFLGEVRTARRVSHPNVCRVHDVGEAGGQHFLSMEYIDGEDLSSLRGGSAGCPVTRRWRSPARSAPASRPPTKAACCTVTSSRPT